MIRVETEIDKTEHVCSIQIKWLAPGLPPSDYLLFTLVQLFFIYFRGIPNTDHGATWPY